VDGSTVTLPTSAPGPGAVHATVVDVSHRTRPPRSCPAPNPAPAVHCPAHHTVGNGKGVKWGRIPGENKGNATELYLKGNATVLYLIPMELVKF
jgi:hypothetical protein